MIYELKYCHKFIVGIFAVAFTFLICIRRGKVQTRSLVSGSALGDSFDLLSPILRQNDIANFQKPTFQIKPYIIRTVKKIANQNN